MQIRRFFSTDIPDTGNILQLSESESRHALKVLRLRPGDSMLILDGKGTIAQAELTKDGQGGRNALCKILSRTIHQPPSPSVRLYVAPPRGKSFDLLLKAATELGFAQVTPILCCHGVAKPEDIHENWENTLIAACKQSINPFLPRLDAPLPFEMALKTARETGFFGAVPNNSATVAFSAKGENCPALALWIGPEGGFSAEEEAALLDAGCHPVTLGHCVLRVETAVPALFGLLQGLFLGRNV